MTGAASSRDAIAIQKKTPPERGFRHGELVLINEHYAPGHVLILSFCREIRYVERLRRRSNTRTIIFRITVHIYSTLDKAKSNKCKITDSAY